jgi:predicted nucleic acid-binding protein
MTVEQALEGVTAALLDSAPIIYLVERHPRYIALMEDFLRARAERRVELVTTPVTLAECLVQPIQTEQPDLIAAYTQTLLDGEGISFHKIDGIDARVAAEVRAEYRLRLPDAFQVAIARRTGCEAVLTNDTSFKRVDHPRAIILDELLEDDA